MTTQVDIINRALQTFGTRTNVTAGELLANSTNEAKQANLIYDNVRQDLLRMAPWDCALFYANLTYITSAPGTPENQSPVTVLWTPGQPPPPWIYEMQYPVDCLRACFIVPSNQTGSINGTPIFPVSTGGAPTAWLSQPVKFKVVIDRFYPVTAAAVVSGGSGYAVGDLITLASGPSGSPPIGAPAVLRVTAAPGGVVSTVAVVNQILGADTPMGGSYFEVQANPVAQGSTTGAGTGATFNLTFGDKGDQRVVVTNQEYPVMAYCRDVTDTNVMDPLFQSAFINALGAAMCIALTGDKQLANICVNRTNAAIAAAREVDGNEGLTINDVTPDWLRIRGVAGGGDWGGGPWTGFDWGPYWSTY